MQAQQSHHEHQPDPPEAPRNETASERALSNELRELAEEDGKSALPTEHPQKSLANASRVDKDSNNNTLLANSELIQVPLQQLQQLQAPLRLSTPPPNTRQPNFIQTNGQQPALAYNPSLRASLRASLQPTPPGQLINQGLTQHFSGWISQPSTTQARIQTNVRDFPTQAPPFQPQPRVPANMQQAGVPRPSSASPQRITFNYQSNQKNPVPQPQPVVVPPQPQPVVVLPQPRPQPQPQPVVIPQPTRPIDNSSSAVFILPQQNQVIIWQQRYFVILEKFQYYYTRMEVIHKKVIYLNQAIDQTKKTEELQLLRAESQELLHLITTTEQELTETIHRNRELLADNTNWKQKYEELAKAFETLRQAQSPTNEELYTKVDVLNQQLTTIEANYQIIVKNYQEELTKNEQLEQEVLALNARLHQLQQQPPANYQEFQLQYKELAKIIEEKNAIILGLKKIIEERDSSAVQKISPAAAEVLEKEIKRLEEEITTRNNTISELLEENSELKSLSERSSAKYEDALQQFRREVAEQQHTITAHEATLKKYEALLEAKTSEINNISKQSISSQGTPRNTSSELQLENRRLKHELTVYEESHSSDLKILNAKIQELLDRTKMISSERDTTVASLQEKAVLLESDINRKDGSIRNLRDRILELEEEKRIRDLDRKYEPKRPEEGSQGQEVSSLRRELSDKVNEIEELEAQLTEYKRITNQYEDSLRVKKHEINTLKRELEEKNEGVQTSSQLNDQLSKKNAELAELRNKLVEQEKISNQNEVLRQQNLHLNESLRKKHNELTEAADKVYFLEKKARELEALSDKSPKMLHLAQEIELLEAANAKKDQEIAKLRQNSQLLQSNIDELELELDRIKGRLSAGEKSSENERSELKGKLSVLDLKVVQYERKIAGLEEVRTIMTEQINTLTTEIHIKYENQQRVEQELKQERARSKGIETEAEQQLVQNEEIRNKLREWEKKYQNLNKELEAEFEKKKDLSNTKKNELFNLNNKYIELQNTLKGKDTRIKQLEKIVDSLNGKIRNIDNNLEEIQYLKHKITQYEHKISNLRSLSILLQSSSPVRLQSITRFSLITSSSFLWKSLSL